jgi:general secretion pathway protein J
VRRGFSAFGGVSPEGFTLVEMLIALTIFGMLTAAGVALLTLTVRTQATSQRLLDEVGALRRLGALLTADLAQAAPRISRDAEGRPRPALIGGGGGDNELLLALVRSGGGEQALQRVEYRLRGGRLERLAFARVDGDARAVAVPLLEGVSQVRLRYRGRDGAWQPAWSATDPTRMPRAVELVSVDAAHGIVRQLFLVGAGR